jgi:hypothetical protein
VSRSCAVGGKKKLFRTTTTRSEKRGRRLETNQSSPDSRRIVGGINTCRRACACVYTQDPPTHTPLKTPGSTQTHRDSSIQVDSQPERERESKVNNI